VAITLLVLLLAFRVSERPLTGRGTVGYGASIVLLLFVSHAAVFSTVAAGVVLFVGALARRPSDLRWRIALVGFWALAVAAAVAHARSVQSSADVAYLRRFWAHGFLPDQGALGWLWTSAQTVLSGPPMPLAFDGSLHYPGPAVFAFLVAVGAVVLCVRKPFAGSLILLPIALTLAAAAARAYPFNARLCLFLLPLFLLLMVSGAEALGSVVRWPAAETIGPLLLLPFAIWAFAHRPPPWTPEHLRPVLERMAERRQPGDALWIYYGAGQAYAYYSKSMAWPGEVRFATCSRADPRDLLRQVDAERGRARVWILMAHGSGPFGFDERGMLIGYLETIGRRLDRFHAPPHDSTRNRAEAALFDLSDPERLAATTAEGFPIAEVPPPQRWTCYGTMSPLEPAK